MNAQLKPADWRAQYGTTAPTMDADQAKAYAEWLLGFQSRPWDWVLTCYPWGIKGSPLQRRLPELWQRKFLMRLQAELQKPGVSVNEVANRVLRFAVAAGNGVGKTGLVAWLVHWFMSCFPHGEAVITAGTRDQLDGKTWRELLKWQSLAVNGWQMEWTATRYKQRDAPGTWFAEARAWSESNPDAMAGTHEKYVLMLFDEASAIANIIWETVEGAMTTGYVFFFVFGNPTQLSGGFYNCFHGLGANRWIQDRVDAREVSFANKPEIDSWITTWGADSDFVRVHVHGMFPRQENASFISTSVIDAAAQRVIQWREIPQAIPRLLGVDIARQGTDLNTIIRRQGRKMLKEIDRFHERNLMATADYIIRIINEWRPALVFVDGVGVGAGVVDNLWQRGFRDIVIDVQSGTTSKDPKEAIRFLNMRSVMWARMREWLTMADLPMDPQLMEELAAPRFKFTLNTDKLVIESKDDMRARGVKSPNVADALAHTFWQAIPVAPGSMGYAEPEVA